MKMSREQFMFFTAGQIFGHFSSDEENNFIGFSDNRDGNLWNIFHNSHLDYTISYSIRDIVQRKLDEMYELGDEPYECKCEVNIFNDSCASITYRRINKNGQGFATWDDWKAIQSNLQV